MIACAALKPPTDFCRRVLACHPSEMMDRLLMDKAARSMTAAWLSGGHGGDSDALLYGGGSTRRGILLDLAGCSLGLA